MGYVNQSYKVQHIHDANSSKCLCISHKKTDCMRSQHTFWIIKISMGFCSIIVCNFLFNINNMWILFITNKKTMLQVVKKGKSAQWQTNDSLYFYREQKLQSTNMQVPLIHTFGNSCWRRIDDVLHPTISFCLVKWITCQR
jgi:hypothetical protein